MSLSAEVRTAGLEVADNLVCYHCGEHVPTQVDYTVLIAGSYRSMCCPGCAAVASIIGDAGLEGFYQRRTAYNQRPVADHGDPDEYQAIFDCREIATDFTEQLGENQLRAKLLLGGLTCAACTWLLEHVLSSVEGVEHVAINLTQQRLEVIFRPSCVKLSELARRIDSLGYSVRPFQQAAQREMLEQDRRASLRRLAVAGIGMMQVGMIAIALHAGDLQGIAMQYRDLLRAASAILTAIVVVYSARGFFTSAWNHLRQGGLVMDLPVSLAIGLAFSASLWATVTGSGQVYFDSVTMFTFFLLLGRYFESQGRRRLALLSIDVEDLLPSHVARLSEGNWQITARSQLQLEDLVLVRAGSTLPVDGIIERGSGHVNQASFDGEHLPRAVTEGDWVYAGTVNLDGSLEVRVAVNPTQTRLAALKRCIEGAIDSKPGITRLADWIAGRFVAAILVISALTAAYYWATDPERMLWVCLSVLVVSCPCALALATPAALSAATHSLLRQGVLVRGEYALEALAAVSHFIFDKTGTLTKGNFALVRTISLGDATPARVLELSAGLQAHANHPLATIFHGRSSIKMESCEQILGAGVQGYSQGVCYRIGSLEFCRELWPGMPPPPPGDLHWMGLCSGQSALGWLALSDQLREESASVVIALQNDQLDVALLSGDSSDAVDRVADELGISTRLRSCTPQGKLDYITQLQNSGARVAMVGDGLNDAPVLRGADVSFAVAGATDLARAEADIVISNDSLSPILKAVDTARTCQRVIRQNLGWALAYNISAIPLAAAGLVPPWAAAIGMSASSLLVVANSLRLNRRHKQHPARYLGQANG